MSAKTKPRKIANSTSGSNKEQERERKEREREKEEAEDMDNTWDCTVCTFRNRFEAFKCEVCDTRFVNSTSVSCFEFIISGREHPRGNVSFCVEDVVGCIIRSPISARLNPSVVQQQTLVQAMAA